MGFRDQGLTVSGSKGAGAMVDFISKGLGLGFRGFGLGFAVPRITRALLRAWVWVSGLDFRICSFTCRALKA